MTRHQQKRECQFYGAPTSSCLRPYVVTIYSLERGTLALCMPHIRGQDRRDQEMRDIVMGAILQEKGLI